MSDLLQYLHKFNVWESVVAVFIVHRFIDHSGPFFIDSNLTIEKYENLLKNHIIFNIENLFDADMFDFSKIEKSFTSQ